MPDEVATQSACNRVWDKGLQPERTALAWQRAGLSLLGCSLLLVAIDKQRLHLAWFLPSLVVTLLAAWIVAWSHRRYHHAHHVLVGTRTDDLPDGRLPLLVALATAGLGCVALLALFGR